MSSRTGSCFFAMTMYDFMYDVFDVYFMYDCMRDVFSIRLFLFLDFIILFILYVLYVFYV